MREEPIEAKRGEEKEKRWREGEYAITGGNLARMKGGGEGV